jgi:hypothetical protein
MINSGVVAHPTGGNLPPLDVVQLINEFSKF